MSKAFQSEAQRRKWEQLVNEGRVSQAQFDERAKETGDTQLPERAAPRKRTVGASRAPDAAQFGKTLY